MKDTPLIMAVAEAFMMPRRRTFSALNKSQNPLMVAPERKSGVWERAVDRSIDFYWKALAQLFWSCVCGLFASLVRRELLPPGSGGIYSSRPTYTLLDLRAIDLMVSRQRRGKVRHGGGGWEEPEPALRHLRDRIEDKP